MKNLPAREKLDLAEKVAEYLVLAPMLDKTSAPEDFDRANELSLELAMLLPATIYRAMVEATTRPDSKTNPASVAIMMRCELLGIEEGGLQPTQLMFHGPTAFERPKLKAHH